MPHAAVNGIEIAYEVMGDGPPLLMLAGLGGAGRSWGAHRERFATEFTTIVPDHRGTGDSTPALDGYTIEAHATDMAELLRALEAAPAHVVGSSTGGAIGQLMALDHPDVVRSLCLVSSWAGPDDYFERQFAVRKRVLLGEGVAAYADASALFLFAPSFAVSQPEVVRAWRDKAVSGTKNPEIMARRIDMIVAHDQRARLRDVEVPTMVLVGSEDICTPPHASRELAGLIPDATLEVMDAGHLVYNERPEEFHALVAGFLRSH